MLLACLGFPTFYRFIPIYSTTQPQVNKGVRKTRVTRNITRELKLANVELKNTHVYLQTNTRVPANKLAITGVGTNFHGRVKWSCHAVVLTNSCARAGRVIRGMA